MQSIRRQVIAALGAALGGAALAQGAPARSFAVVSEMAREISVVTFQESTGTRIGANLRSRVEIPEGALEKVALFTARDALRRVDAGAPVWLVAPLASDLFGARQSAEEGDRVPLPADLVAEMKSRGSTHLLLMQRFRGEAQLKARREYVGTGQLDGVGFYLDRTQPMLDAETGAEIGRGFIAPYVYVRLSIIDAASGRVLRSRVVKDGDVIVGEDAAAGVHPWDGFTPSQKVQMLSERLVGAIERVVPELLAGL